MKKKIIIDTDPGIDDAMAIMLAIKSGAFDIQALTTVCGNASIKNTTKNARFILDALDRANIPVYSGAAKPLKKKLNQAAVHGVTGLDGANVTNKAKLTNNAAQKIAEIARRNPNEVTLICLGPLTNIAKTITNYPIDFSLLKDLIIMGGAISVPGNMNRVAEFNVFCDPDAAKIVFDFPIKKTLVLLDLCNTITMNMQDFKSIKKNSLTDTLFSIVNPYIKNLYRIDRITDAVMYDPLTIYACLYPEKVKTLPYNIVVETKGEFTEGMTVADRRNKKDLKPNINVATQVNPELFKKDFIRIVSKP